MENLDNKRQHDVDAVIAWVDGTDPLFLAKLTNSLKHLNYQGNPEEYSQDRFSPHYDIFTCVLSIRRFAPFIRNIHIVTDQQDPGINRYLEKVDIKWARKVKIVDHTQIFSDYLEVLPVFNSLSIETMLYKIPGLAEHYIYFNDDFFLTRDVEISDFFVNGFPKIRGYVSYRNSLSAKYDISKAKNSNTIGFVMPMVTASQISYPNINQFIRLFHTPYAMRKSTLEKFAFNNKNSIKSNIKYKLRSTNQFNTAALCGLIEYMEFGNRPIRDPCNIYLKPLNRFPGYCNLKLLPFYINSNIKFGCIQSLASASDHCKKFLWEWLQKHILGFKLKLD